MWIKLIVMWLVLLEDLCFERKLFELRILENYCRCFLDWGDWDIFLGWLCYDIRYFFFRNSIWIYCDMCLFKFDFNLFYMFIYILDFSKLFCYFILMVNLGRKFMVYF